MICVTWPWSNYIITSDNVLARGFEFSRPIHGLLNGEPEHDRTIFGHS